MAQLAPYQTPGVTIVEQNAFPDSVVEVATAIPAFVGYTEKASYKGKPLANVPTRVESLQDFVNKFGAGFTQVFDLVLDVVGSNITAGTLTGGTLANLTTTNSVVTADIAVGTIAGATYATPSGTPTSNASLTGAALTGATVTIAVTAGKLTAGKDGTTDISGDDITAGTLTAGTLANITVQGSTVTADITGGTITKADYTPTNGQAVTGATITGANLTRATVTITVTKGTFTAGKDGSTDVTGNNITAGTLTGGTPTITEANGEFTADITGGTLTAATYASAPGTAVTGNLTGAALTGATVTITGVAGTLDSGTVGTTALPAGTLTGGTLTGGTLANITVKGTTVTANIAGGTITGATFTPTGGTATTPPPTITAAKLTGATVTIEIKDGTFTAGTFASDPTALPAVTLTFTSGRTAALTPQLNPQGTGLFYLYNSLQLFYQNGGGPCYIVSIGGYDSTPTDEAFIDSFKLLEPEQDPTMLLCPDALLLQMDAYYKVVDQMLEHCADVQKRVALFDVYGGDGPASFPTLDDIDDFRTNVGENNLNYGITYFPWVYTTVVEATDLSFRNLTPDALIALASLVPTPKPPANGPVPTPPASLFTVSFPASPPLSAEEAAARDLALNNKLKAVSPEYKLTLDTMAAYLGTLPVAPAMAGVYTAVDSSRGVWKAPANVSLNSVIKPTVPISDAQQANLNVDAMTGKSINAIRAFKGLGNLVWGARTLDGNSQDWRYVNVRRTMIMIEQSMKLAARNTVFEPNDANTWTTFKSMLNSFLFVLWKQGALAGAKPDDAYSVQVGLGTTMTADDILNGIMNVTVLVALVRPAEFIMLTFKQQMQVS